jgi:hypothetical protein
MAEDHASDPACAHGEDDPRRRDAGEHQQHGQHISAEHHTGQDHEADDCLNSTLGL